MRLDYRGYLSKYPLFFVIWQRSQVRLKTPVCKTGIREFKSHRCLQGGWRNSSRSGILYEFCEKSLAATTDRKSVVL